MTERKCACNKLFSILVNLAGGAPTKRNWIPNFYRQCKLGWDDEINFSKISFLSHSHITLHLCMGFLFILLRISF
ncbi:hypothetical protein F6R46_06355 [Staphylococcus aureus]|nr:hypothetical protein [Staphylococcus aureus]MBG1135737.1 hypothetical protein [Staphylococcus aureus]MCB4386909.1 hypothetical protein [Staphylococcus aureus]MCB4402124.1 hypothetical protein [Staphylococcus aureus]QCW87321.1 hypothetical protein FD482_13230 [Staphylococcus aureus]